MRSVLFKSGRVDNTRNGGGETYKTPNTRPNNAGAASSRPSKALPAITFPVTCNTIRQGAMPG